MILQYFADKRNIFRAAALILTYSLLIFLIRHSTEKLLFSIDYSEYWASSRLLLAGENPYSTDLMWKMQRKITGWHTDRPVMMYNPPWVFGLILPLGLLTYSCGRVIWLILGLSIILLSSDICWLLYGGAENERWKSWLISILFVPSLIILKTGQITTFVLLGLVGFLFSVKNQKWYLAGLCIFFMTLKPNFIYLFWPVLILWIINQKRWKILGAWLATVSSALVVPIFLNNQIILQYPEAFSVISPYYWKTPTLSTGLRLLFGIDQYWLLYVPPIIGLMWFSNHWLKHNQKWIWLDQMPILLLVSASTTFFGWTHDLILLLPVIIKQSIRITRTPKLRPIVNIIYLIINSVIGLILIMQFDSFTGVIIPPLIMLFYFFVTHYANREEPSIDIKIAKLNRYHE